MKATRIIFIRGAVETLEFFSLQMAEALQAQGFKTWFWDMKAPLSSREHFLELNDYEHTVLVTFNFIGLSGESQFHSENTSLWEEHGVPVFCIMVDHPMYYYKRLRTGIKNLTLICIDRDHQSFVSQYYPEYGKVHFLPLAGTMLPGAPLPMKDRNIDVIFAGNYVPPDRLTPHIHHMDEESRDFYFDIIEELIRHPDRPMEQELIARLTGEFPQITREETLSCLHSMIFIDLYVRSWFRREIICSLAEAGIPVTVIGKDWEKAGCKRQENLILTGQKDSLACLKAMGQAKISVNVMPWFKNGAHDRIFNGMLQGCTVVTDSSAYLDEIICSKTDYIAFHLDRYQEISRKVSYLLEHPGETECIAAAGYKKAAQSHTWANRALTLLDIISRDSQ